MFERDDGKLVEKVVKTLQNIRILNIPQQSDSGCHGWFVCLFGYTSKQTCDDVHAIPKMAVKEQK